MNSISEKGLTTAAVRWLNQPIVKESVKKIISSVTFVFGLAAIYDLYQIADHLRSSIKVYAISPGWLQTANKIIITCAKISLILSALVSRPGVCIINCLGGWVLAANRLEPLFGPNTIFAVNPWHPRHVVSIAAVILALPSVIQSIYKSIKWCKAKYTSPEENNCWLNNSKIRLMALFNTMTSRPTLHMGNQLGRHILKPL